MRAPCRFAGYDPCISMQQAADLGVLEPKHRSVALARRCLAVKRAKTPRPEPGGSSFRQRKPLGVSLRSA